MSCPLVMLRGESLRVFGGELVAAVLAFGLRVYEPCSHGMLSAGRVGVAAGHQRSEGE